MVLSRFHNFQSGEPEIFISERSALRLITCRNVEESLPFHFLPDSEARLLADQLYRRSSSLPSLPLWSGPRKEVYIAIHPLNPLQNVATE